MDVIDLLHQKQVELFINCTLEHYWWMKKPDDLPAPPFQRPATLLNQSCFDRLIHQQEVYSGLILFP